MKSGGNNWLFRADGNSKIGMGHIMRCLSIADAVRENGDDCVFVLSDSNCRKTISDRGYDSIITNYRYDSFADEVDLILDLINQYRCKYFFVDSYYAEYNYLQEVHTFLKEINGVMICMDGNAHFPYPCDVFINYNIFGPDKYQELVSRYSGKTINAPRFLLGTEYVPLRNEFLEDSQRVVQKTPQNILISTGGADHEHLAIALVNAIMRADDLLQYHFVIGEMNKDKGLLEEKMQKARNITMHYSVKKMRSLMLDMDIAISAAGSTLYELCATQTPTITYILADNQIPGAIAFEKKGLMKCAGDIRDLGTEKLAESLLNSAKTLADNYAERVSMAHNMRTILDVHGARNIVNAIMQCQTKEE